MPTRSAHVGLGVTWYGAFRNQWRRIEKISQGIASDSSGCRPLDLTAGSYSTIRTLAKFGASFASGPVTVGATLTTPSLHISGSGELGLDHSIFGSDTTALAASTQPDLDAEYKSPLSRWRRGGAPVGQDADSRQRRVVRCDSVLLRNAG